MIWNNQHVCKNNMNMGKERSKSTLWNNKKTTTTTRADWGCSDKSHVKHAAGATVCINVPKLRGQENRPIQN